VITVHDGATVSNGLEFTLAEWQPSSIVGLTSWLRGDSYVLGTGSAVAQLTDKTGFGRHLVQATAGKQPLLIASDPNFNGQPSIDFDGVDDYMTGAVLSTLFTNMPSPIQATAAVVFRADAITGTGTIAAPYNNNAVLGAVAGGLGLTLHNSPAPVQAFAYCHDGAYQVAVNTSIAALQIKQAVVTVQNNVVDCTLNGVAATPDTYVTPTIGATAFAIGSNLTYTANFLNGQIAEVVTSNVSWTAIDLMCWPNYCAHRYGTP
jgi:hypothetical protein